MIYLICAEDSEEKSAEITKQKDMDSHFWNFFLENTLQKNVLFSYSFFKKFVKEILPNRVNLIYSNEKKKNLPNITNAVVCNNLRQIEDAFANKNDDLYVYAEKSLLEMFVSIADYLIVYHTDNLTSTDLYMLDSVNFSNFNFLSKRTYHTNEIVYYFVKTKDFLRR